MHIHTKPHPPRERGSVLVAPMSFGRLVLVRELSKEFAGNFAPWKLPGGRVEEKDFLHANPALAAGRRELREETGLTLPWKCLVRQHRREFLIGKNRGEYPRDFFVSTVTLPKRREGRWLVTFGLERFHVEVHTAASLEAILSQELFLRKQEELLRLCLDELRLHAT